MTGTGTVNGIPQAVLPWTYFGAADFYLWVSNAGAHPVSVLFHCSPDGVFIDQDSDQAVTAAPGQSISVCRSFPNLIGWWRVTVWNPTGESVPVQWGVRMQPLSLNP